MAPGNEFAECPRMDPAPTSSRENAGARAAAARRGRRLEQLTLGWNIAEAAIAIGAGIAAGSIALVGFGADSLVECVSGAALWWRLQTHEADEARERRALKLVGASFLLIAAWVVFDAAKALIEREAPEVSVIGIGLSILSLIVMPLLARAKRRVAAELESRALTADARQTDLCAWLSAILLGGLVLNALAGWWWADPVAALVMTPIIAREGLEALRGERCDDCG